MPVESIAIVSLPLYSLGIHEKNGILLITRKTTLAPMKTKDNQHDLPRKTYVIAAIAIGVFGIAACFILRFGLFVALSLYFIIRTKKSNNFKDDKAVFRQIVRMFFLTICIVLIESDGYLLFSKSLWPADWFRLGFIASLPVLFMLFELLYRCLIPVIEWNVFDPAPCPCPTATPVQGLAAAPKTEAETLKPEQK